MIFGESAISLQFETDKILDFSLLGARLVHLTIWLFSGIMYFILRDEYYFREIRRYQPEKESLMTGPFNQPRIVEEKRGKTRHQKPKSHKRQVTKPETALKPIPVSSSKYEASGIDPVEGVRCIVPSSSDNMVPIEKHTFKCQGRDIAVSDHWRSSQYYPGRTILQRNFFGITKADLGKNITATVTIERKTTSNGRNVVLLNITKTEGIPEYDLRFPKTNGDEIDGITLPIEGCEHCVAFVERKPRPERRS